MNMIQQPRWSQTFHSNTVILHQPEPSHLIFIQTIKETVWPNNRIVVTMHRLVHLILIWHNLQLLIYVPHKCLRVPWWTPCLHRLPFKNQAKKLQLISHLLISLVIKVLSSNSDKILFIISKALEQVVLLEIRYLEILYQEILCVEIAHLA